MLLLLEHTFLLLSHPLLTTKVVSLSLRFRHHAVGANPLGEDVSGVLVTPSGWQCEHWLTSTADLPALKDDLHRVETELDVASRLGMIRQQQGLTIDVKKLVVRIEGLENIDARD